MDQNFLSLLVHPVYKTPLQYDEVSKQLIDKAHNDDFIIKENVPISVSYTHLTLPTIYSV